jgi:hypothetical protein
MNGTVEAFSSALLGAPHVLRVRRLGIDTHQEPVVYTGSESYVRLRGVTHAASPVAE